MLRLCGEAEDKLAQELIHFELQVERDVIEPLFVLAEVSGGWGRPRVRVAPCRGLASETRLRFTASAADVVPGPCERPSRFEVFANCFNWQAVFACSAGLALGRWSLLGSCSPRSRSSLPLLKAEALTLLFLTHFSKLRTHTVIVWDIFFPLLFSPAANFVFQFYLMLFPPLLCLAKCPGLGSDFIFPRQRRQELYRAAGVTGMGEQRRPTALFCQIPRQRVPVHGRLRIAIPKSPFPAFSRLPRARGCDPPRMLLSGMRWHPLGLAGGGTAPVGTRRRGELCHLPNDV